MQKKTIHLFLAFFLLTSISACTISPTIPPEIKTPTAPNPVTVPYLPLVEADFWVTVPETEGFQKIYLDILDEITGLSFNIARYEMQWVDTNRYQLRIPVPDGSVIKYRYVLEKETLLQETNIPGDTIRYRLLYVKGATTTTDIVSSWKGASNISIPDHGFIQGVITDSATQMGIPGIFISAGGVSTISLADGSFVLPNLPVGNQTMVAVSMDGAYHPYQQGAIIAPNAGTPAQIQMSQTEYVNVTFHVSPPEDGLKGIPVRIVGNLLSLGNTFGGLDSEFSVIAARAPKLQYDEKGSYSVTLSLPVGYDLRYKYSLGDGFWNSEHYANGNFRTRQVIVPDRNIDIYDEIETWKYGQSAPVRFTVQVPGETPVTDTVSIQFKYSSSDWMIPIPMWQMGNNRWSYILYGPFLDMGSMYYRYCRNDQCGTADDASTVGWDASGLPFHTNKLQQDFQDTVDRWIWVESSKSSTQVVASEITARGDQFWAGVEYVPLYHSTWLAYESWAVQYLKTIGANRVILTPAWIQVGDSIIGTAQNNPIWHDINLEFTQIDREGLRVVLHPYILTSSDEVIGIQNWQTWWVSYQRFILHFAEMASKMNFAALVIEDPRTNNTGNLECFEKIPTQDWLQLVSDIRQRYAGKILWAVPFPASDNLPDGWINLFDGVYLQWSAPLSNQSDPSIQELQDEFTRLLLMEVQPFYEKHQKPIYLSMDYESIDGAASNCIEWNNSCLELNQAILPSFDYPNVSLDLQEQADIYNAALLAINNIPWINGFISSGFFPPVILQDKSSSIYGKPAGDVLWYWFPKMVSNN